MKSNSATGITVGKSQIEGKGCFAATDFRKWQKIAEYAGERISRAEISRRLRRKGRIYICGIDSYWGIDASRGGNATRFINHSCAPNCFSRVIHGHLIFFALRDISSGEEITLDYVDSYHSDRTSCRCQAPNCRSTINKVRKSPDQR